LLARPIPLMPEDTALKYAVIKPTTPLPGYKVVLNYEQGGNVSLHWDRFETIAKRGDEVELRGDCYSACTLIMSLVKRENICFGPKAALHFHQASRVGSGPDAGKPSYDTTAKMVASYPADIQAWINVKGGAYHMPHTSYWTLTAPDLWAMSYHRCDRSEVIMP